jgi:hypothetical protein
MNGSRLRERVARMPYDLTLEQDHDRGGTIYRALFERDVEPSALRDLSDWLDDARLNPDATFVIDLAEDARTTPRARFELRALLRRHRQLTIERRLSVVTPARRSGAALQVAPLMAMALPL